MEAHNTLNGLVCGCVSNLIALEKGPEKMQESAKGETQRV
jgi:hypothetical protein